MVAEQLLLAARDGQRRDPTVTSPALARLVAELETELYSFFRKRRHPHDVAEDLSHDTIMVVIEKLPTLDDDPERPSLRSWVFATARNKSRSLWRKEGRRAETSLRRALHIPAPGGSLSSRARLAEQKIELDRQLAAMPPHLRDMAEFDLDEGDRKAFANAKGIVDATMRSQRRRYRDYLREHFSDFFDDP